MDLVSNCSEMAEVSGKHKIQAVYTIVLTALKLDMHEKIHPVQHNKWLWKIVFIIENT